MSGCNPKFPSVDDVLPNGYKVLAVYRNEYLLAVKHEPETQFAVWHLDRLGETYSGSYFKDAERAERHFAELCFTWLYPPRIIIPYPKANQTDSNGVVIDMASMNAAVQEKCGVSKKILFDNLEEIEDRGMTYEEYCQLYGSKMRWWQKKPPRLLSHPLAYVVSALIGVVVFLLLVWLGIKLKP